MNFVKKKEKTNCDGAFLNILEAQSLQFQLKGLDCGCFPVIFMKMLHKNI